MLPGFANFLKDQAGPKKNAQYISVSRRTDIPRFYGRCFLEAWSKGAITYRDGYGRTHTVSLLPEDVLGFIFWSKDFAPFLQEPLFHDLIRQANVLFHFTLNHCPDLEPGVAPLSRRLATLQRLCDLVGPQRVVWRFDPICKYHADEGPLRTNAAAFYEILPWVARAGVERCYFSFMSFYAKLRRRHGVSFLPFTAEEQNELIRPMNSAAQAHNLTLYHCCAALGDVELPALRTGSCIDDELLVATDRFNRHRALTKKPTRPGCHCYASRDIGSYHQRCRHNCLYCYANPQAG